MRLNTILTFLFLLYFFPFFAQTATGISGTVQDTVNNSPAGFVSVLLYRDGDTTAVNGCSSDSAGKFRMENVKPGKYFVRASGLGFITSAPVHFMVNDSSRYVNIGMIHISPDPKTMAAAVITSERSDYSADADKKVYVVGQNITSTGGTATDVLQNVPSVTVDNEGNVSLHGSQNVTVLIDGKPSGITGSDRQSVLQQIPAGMIDRIEVITNPSSKYDAQGMGGIINIVTKKGDRKGWNGNITVGAGTHNKYNAALAIGHRGQTLNVYSNFNFRYEDRYGMNHIEQHNFTSDTSYYYNIQGGTTQRSLFGSGKIGADWNISKQQFIGISAGYSMQTQDKLDSTQYDFLDENMLITSSFQRNAWSDELTQTADASFNYKYNSKNSHHSFALLGSFSGNRKEQDAQYQNSFYGFENPAYQKNNGLTDFTTSIAQADYAWHITDSLDLSAGLKYGLRHSNNKQLGERYDFMNQWYGIDQQFTDHFVFDEGIYAGYAQIGQQLKKIKWQIGVRSEYTSLVGASGSTGLHFSNPYFSFFPSGTMVYEPKSGTQMRVSYSRRLNRPNNQQINPFMDFSDSITIRTGDPQLKPEFIHSAESEFIQMWENFSVDITVYYRHTDNMISMARIYDLATGQAIMKPRNFSSSDNFGSDLTIRASLGKKITAMLSASAYRSVINGENIEPGLQTAYFGWNGKLSLTYKITSTIAAQVNGNYGAPMRQPVGWFQMPGGIDAGARWDIAKGKGSFTVNCTDIFNTKRYRLHGEYTGYEYNGWRKRESLVFNVSFTWLIGMEKAAGKKSIIQQEEGGGGE